MKTVHIRIEGRVQGVFFRDYTQKQAHSLGLTGWVKNMADGAVEGIFCGEDQDIAAMISWLHSGSPHADVAKVTVNDYDTDDNFTSFEIIF